MTQCVSGLKAAAAKVGPECGPRYGAHGSSSEQRIPTLAQKAHGAAPGASGGGLGGDRAADGPRAAATSRSRH